MGKLFSIVDFKQKRESCVIASYAVAVSDLMGRNVVQQVIEAYCIYYALKLDDVSEAENVYDSDFHSRCEREGRSGYSIIKELHNQSLEEIIQEARDSIALEDISGSELERVLRENGTRAMVFINKAHEISTIASSHSIAIGFNGDKFEAYDTNGGETKAFENIHDIAEELGSCFLLRKR